ncbi:MAG: efflux RND transporter permease subunit [Vicinamibacterales bacterium]
MIARLIRHAFHAPLLTVLLVTAGVTVGAVWLQDLQRDVFPDLSAPVFNVITQNPAMGAEELETAIAIPLEVALAGLPNVRRVRSNSQLGVTQVTIEFDPSADYYRSRQFVAERVSQASGQLPAGTDPPLISSLTGRLNEIFEFTLEADPGAADLMTLRDLAEFEVNNRLLAVPGVAAVERLGGYLRQFQVQLDPERLSARRVSLDEVLHAVDEANLNASGGIVAQGSIEWTVRAIGRAQTVEDLRRTVVVIRGDVPVLLGDIADVREAPAVRRGIAHRLKGEVVSARVIKQFGADTVTVAAGIRAAVDDIRRTLPAGVQLRVVYDQSQLVSSALGGVGRAVMLGGIFVVLVVLLLLGNLRAALIVTLTIPLSIALAGLLLRPLGIGVNTMTLGGLAIAVGLLVDAAIIMVENILHRLRGTASSEDRRLQAMAAAGEVARPIAFATGIVIVVFLPLFGMSGIEGRMYQPLAAAVIASMAAALVLAITLVPIAAVTVLRPSSEHDNEDVGLVRQIKRGYAPLLDWCLLRPIVVAAITVGLAVPSIVLGTRIGSDFMPQMDEGAFLLQTVLPAEAALDEVDRLNHRVEDVLRQVPEVEDVVRRTGRAERTEDPMPHTMSDVLVVLRSERSRSMEEIEADMRARVEAVPGVAVLFTTPLGMRIDEGLGGTPADLSVKIFGPDLNELARLAEQSEALIRDVPGITDLRTEQLTGLPQLQIAVDRDATARVGLAPGDVTRAVRVGLVGEDAAQIWIGQRRFDLVVRLRDDRRDTVDAIRTLLIDGHDGRKIPARPTRHDLADVRACSHPPRSWHAAHQRGSIRERTRPGKHGRGRARDPDQSTHAAGGLLLRSRWTRREPGTCRTCVGPRDWDRPLRRLRAAARRARFGSRSRVDPRHRPRGVRRRHRRPAACGRELERVVACRPHRPVRHRGAEQPGAGDADTRIGRRGACAGRRGARGEHRPRAPEADDGRHGDTRPAPAAGAAASRHRDRAAAGHRHDGRTGDLHAVHAARAPHVLSSRACVDRTASDTAGSPRRVELRSPRRTKPGV